MAPIKEELKKYLKYKDFVKRYDRDTLDPFEYNLNAAGLHTARNEFARRMERLEHAVAQLTDPTEQLLIRLRYFDGYSWTKIGFAMHYSKSSLQRIHVQALKHLEQIGVVIEEVTS
jgi:RNA polymerase sigma factor (sigma-70 family)